MKKVGLAIIFVFSLLLMACGGGSSSAGNINGNWTATLTDSSNNPIFGFTTSLTQSSGSAVSISNFTFTTNSPCFVSGESETGSFALSGDFNGNVTGSYQMVITSGTPAGNVLTLQGNVNGNTITGSWTLHETSQGCAGASSGNFTMTR